jgi:hypothetical protein
MKPVQQLDDGREQMFELAMVLIGGNRKRIPSAIETVLGGYKGMEPVTNPALRNHLTGVLKRKIHGALMHGIDHLGDPEPEREMKRDEPYLPIVLLPDEETVGE